MILVVSRDNTLSQTHKQTDEEGPGGGGEDEDADEEIGGVSKRTKRALRLSSTQVDNTLFFLPLVQSGFQLAPK